MFWDVAGVVEQTILAPVTRDRLAPAYHQEFIRRLYRVPPATPRIEVLVRIQPIGLDVLDDLIESRHLEASIRDVMPTFDLLPNRTTSDEPATLVWTYEKARAEGYAGNDYLCLESAASAR